MQRTTARRLFAALLAVAALLTGATIAASGPAQAGPLHCCTKG